MQAISSDQLLFIIISAILLFCCVNVAVVFRKQGWVRGESLWLWALVSVTVSYLGYALNPWLGRPSLVVANIGFLIAYICLAFQIRFWLTNKINIPNWVIPVCGIYFITFEFLRDLLPYVARAGLGQGVLSVLLGYLVYLSARLYRNTGSLQILMLGGTFVLEFICVLLRLIILLLFPESTLNTINLLSEPYSMVVLRWIWLIANAMSYLTIMTFVLERVFDRNEELSALLREKRQLINAIGRYVRNDHAGSKASVLTHELSQPVSALLLATERLNAQIKESSLQDIEGQVDFLYVTSTRIANIMRQIEGFFQVRDVDLQPVPVSKVVNGALMVLSSRLETNNIVFEQIEYCDPIVNGEQIQLELLFINLISNAITAVTKQAGPRRIQLECTFKDQHCEIEIRDNGPGISPFVLQNIGQIYVSDHEHGSGVGLWLSKMIVTNHFGKILASNHPSGGASFKVILPATLLPRALSTQN